MRSNPILFMALALLAALLGIAALVATGPESLGPGPDAVMVGLGAEPRSLDPHVVTSLDDFRILVNLYEGLLGFRDGSLEVEPRLAERWEVDGEGLTYRFHLRPGVRFHDGTPFDAEAVRFNFGRMLREDHPCHDTGPFPLASFYFGPVEEVVVVDDLTVELRLERPFAPLLSNLAYTGGLLVSPEAVRRFGRDFGRHPCGTGPFAFAAWEGGRRVVLRRHDGYWGEPARSQQLVYRTVADDMTRIAELRAGGLDLVPEVSADNVSWFRRHRGFHVVEAGGPHLWFLILNVRVPPFSDVRVRRAANLAVDKEAICERVLQGTATVAAGPVPEAFGRFADPSLDPWPHDPERARRLLVEAGYAGGVDVRLLAPQGGSGMLAPVEMAAAIQADLADVGIRVRIETFEWNTFLDRVNGGLGDDVHMAEMAWMTNDPDTLPHLALRSDAHPPDGFNSGWYANAQVDDLVGRARRATDAGERARLYRRMQRIVHDDAPWLFVASWVQNAVARRELEGVRLQPSFFLLLDGVSKR